MGIRYYAYAFDQRLSERALADPRSLISDDPFADSLGLEPHSAVSYPTFEQAVPERDMLYLDKAWRELQFLTAPHEPGGTARPAFAMFEGEVKMYSMGWESWVRPPLPQDLPEINRDLVDLVYCEPNLIFQGSTMKDTPQQEYVMEYLQRARKFVAGLVAEGRGMVYMIG